MNEMVKGFGCRQAYESLSCRKPRATVDGYGDFDFVGNGGTVARKRQDGGRGTVALLLRERNAAVLWRAVAAA